MTGRIPCKLALEDGLVFTGLGFGARGTAQGEVVFNTGMSGYQEVLTDPSYAGQIVAMTYPLIGNYGVNAEDVESHDRRVQVRGFIVKELSPVASNFRSLRSLEEYLELDQGTIQILPNCVVMGDWDVVPATGHDLDGPVLGWFGTENHWDDWSEIVPAVNEALQAVDGHLAVVGAPEVVTLFPDELAARTRVHPLVRMRDFGQIRQLIKSFDVGLAWCTNRTQASRCRSPLKAIQYGAAGVPVVASQTVYGDLEDFAGRLAVDTIQLTEHLIEALTESQETESPTLTQVQEWQTNVWGSHSYEIQAMRWIEILE